jgi:hypothetical protein
VFAGEMQRTVSSAKAADVSGLRACFSFLCRRKAAQVSSLSVCMIIFYAGESNRQAISGKAGNAAQIHPMN